METRTDKNAQQKVWDLIENIKIAQLVTQDDMGRLHSRPMSAIKREGDILWFMAKDDSGKVAEINAHPHVLLSYSEPKDQNYVSIRGTAEVVDDRMKVEELWTEFARAWFPKGPNDQSICLLRIKADAAEYWDAPASAFVYAWGYAKARLTGKPPHNIADMAHVEFQNAM